MHEGDCQKCKDWHGCVGKPWYSYLEIRWCPFQVMWILRYCDVLHSGRWPSPDERPDTVPYEQFHNEAPFVKAALIIAELEHRLARCGVAGKLLKAQARAGDNLDYLEGEAWQALLYVKGFRRKITSFTDWKKDKKKYQKTHQKVGVN